MRLGRAGGALLATALGCTSPRPPLNGPQAGAAPVCEPGTLLFAASQAPQAIALSRDGKLVAIADRGTLVLRDADTLAPVRYLVPQLDHWQDVSFSRDGRSLRAATVDGLRFRIDVATGRVERLLNDERRGARDALMDDQTAFLTLYARRATAMKDHERGFWHDPPPPARFPSLPAGVESNGIALGVMAEVAGARGRRLEPIAEVEARDDGDHARLFIAGSDGKLRAFDMDGRQIAAGAIPAGAEVVRVGVGGDHVLVSLGDGGAAIYDSSLALERRVRVLADPTAPPPAAMHGVAMAFTIGSQKWPPHALRSLDYDPARGRLYWVSTAHEIGVLDVASGRTVAALPGTASFEGVAQMAFLGPRNVAAVAGGRLWVWDPYGAGRADRAGGYVAMAPLGGARVLALGPQGQGDVVEIEPARWELAVRRTVCLAASGDCRERTMAQELVDNHGRLRRPIERELAASPDGKEIALLEWPSLDPRSGGEPRKGRLAVLSAETLAILRSTAIAECERDDSLAFGAREIVACGKHHDRATLAPRAPGENRSRSGSDDGWPKPGVDALFDVLGPDHQRIAVGRIAIGIGHGRNDGYESIVIAQPQGGPFGMLASTAWADSEKPQVYDRGQLRNESMVVASPEGSRFLIASRGTEGALQLWCSPTGGLADLPPEPARPDVMDQDGITEIAVRDFPGVVYDAVEIAGDVLILGLEEHPLHVLEAKRGLWLFAPATRKLARLELPVVPDEAAAAATVGTMSGAPPFAPEVWQRFELAPTGGAWLIGNHHVARRTSDGAWIVHALPEVKGGGATNQVSVIDDALAVHVAARSCPGAKPRPRVGGPGSCFELTLVGAVPATAGSAMRASNEWVGALAAFPGGFVALGGAEIGFRAGRWVGPADPLVVTAANTFAAEGFGRDGELDLHVEGTQRVDVLGIGDGRKRRSFELPFAGHLSPLGPSPGHGPAFWLDVDGDAGAIVDVAAAGKVTVRGNAAVPVWMAGEAFRARGGATGLWWHGGHALIGLNPKGWTATFNPAARATLLAMRRAF
jgi:hypothetical protein